MTWAGTDRPIESGSVDPLQDWLGDLARNWGWVLAYGVATVVLGILVIGWPDATLFVIAVLFAIQLLINGVFQIVGAFGSHDNGGHRALLGILGALSVLVGLLFLRSPLQTLLVIALLIGAWWLISGVIELVGAISGGPMPGRGWRIAMGIISIAAGIFVMLQPDISLFALTVILGIWLILYGLLAVVVAFRLRSAARAMAT